MKQARSRAVARILVVDDDEDVREVVCSILRGDGHDADAATNGVEALRLLDRRWYDLIVSDLKMPELDGPGLYRHILHRWPNQHPPVLTPFPQWTLGAFPQAVMATDRLSVSRLPGES